MVIGASKGSSRFTLSGEEIRTLLEYRERADVVDLELQDSQRRVKHLERSNRLLEHRIELLLKRLYGKSSEKTDPNQLLLFLTEEDADATDEDGVEPVSGHKPKTRPKGHGRDSFPEHFPRTQIALEPDEDERVCSVCDDPLCRVSEQISEKGEYIPGYWLVNQYVRGVWACKKGHGGVVMAPPPPGVVDKSRFEPSAYAHVATAKYADHLPLHRQEGIFQRSGLQISRSTMCDMMRDLSLRLTAIRNEMKRQLLASQFIQTDDTPVDVLIERDGPKHKRKKAKGRIWTYLAPGDIVVYDFTLSWSRDGPAKFLKGFKGTHLQGDNYAGYSHICKTGGLIKVGCWAHVRRKFVEAQSEDQRRSDFMQWRIKWLYRVEGMVRTRLNDDDDYSTERATSARQRLCTRVLGKIKGTLDEWSKSPDVPPASALGKAVTHALNQWDDLKTYLDHLDITPDNNASERALRSVVLGRKNYLFFGSKTGGHTAATLYSLIMTCKALKIDPYAYLLDVTKRLVANQNTPTAELTPWAWRDARIQRISAEIAADIQAEPAPSI